MLRGSCSSRKSAAVHHSQQQRQQAVLLRQSKQAGKRQTGVSTMAAILDRGGMLAPRDGILQ